MSTPAIEAVARAIKASKVSPKPVKETTIGDWVNDDDLKVAAEAAYLTSLRSIRNPSSKVIDKMAATAHTPDNHPRKLSVKQKHRKRWQAGIDKLIAEAER